MRTGTNQRPLTPGQGQQSQQESLAAAAAANPALAYTGMPGWYTALLKHHLPKHTKTLTMSCRASLILEFLLTEEFLVVGIILDDDLDNASLPWVKLLNVTYNSLLSQVIRS